MKLVRSRVRKTACLLGAGLVVSLVSLVSLVACSNGSEGARCEFDNGNDDCKDGLICIPATPHPGRPAPYTVNRDYANSDRCCPADRTQASHPACIAISGEVTDSAPPDALPDTNLPDAAVDAPGTPDAADAADAADGG